MAGLGMNVMHDGNHGSYSTKSWVNKSWAVRFTSSPETFTTGKCSTMYCTTLIPIFTGMMRIWTRAESSVLPKEAEWYRFHKFQHYYSVFLYGLLTFNWALTTDFKQMRAYLKRKLSYGEPKSPKILWTTLIITKIIYVSIWIVLPIVIGIDLVESIDRIFRDALHRRTYPKHRIPIGARGG
jgi:linoleoyl-CoA desaturase